LLQPRPEALDAVAVVVDRREAGDGRLVAAGRDSRARTEIPDVLAEGLAAVAAVGDDPDRHTGQTGEQRHGLGQLMRLTGRESGSGGPARAVGDHAGLGAIAATFEALPRTAKRLTRTPLRRSGVFLAAPAAFRWARIEV